MKPAILVMLTALTGCTGVPQLDDTDLPVLREQPRCDFERLGIVRASDGHRGRHSGHVWGPRGSERNALAKLRAEARSLGGNAVLLINRAISEREAGNGSVQKRPARVVSLTGVAIRDCR